MRSVEMLKKQILVGWIKENVRFVPISIILVIFLIFSSVVYAQEEEQDLTLTLMLPNEGETYYAGPTSMLYMVPISGLVKGGSFPPNQVSVEIAIYQGETLMTSQVVYPDETGGFRIFANVNPGAYSESFQAEYIPCGDTCHFNSDFAFQRDDWNATMDLPAGPMQFIVTATDPTGLQVSALRNIVVDLSGYAIVPVNVIVMGDIQHPVEDIPVTGSTQLYMWRSRISTGGTDSSGIAYLKVEALAQAPTTYRFYVLPSMLDGVVYESTAPVEVIIPPGSTEAGPVTVVVRAILGRVHGQVNGLSTLPQAEILLINSKNGLSRTTQLGRDGTFTFEDIPIGKYLVTMDPDYLAAQGFEFKAETIDLLKDKSPLLKLDVYPLEGFSCQGIVMDDDGNRLPFAWSSIDKLDRFSGVNPETGEFSINGLPAGKATLVANAPGYYSQSKVVDAGVENCTGLQYSLTRNPVTQSYLWGDGEIIVSPETKLSKNGQSFFLERGWLWGQNQENDPIIIQRGGVQFTISKGKFALEDIPGQIAWLYLFEGDGTINIGDGSIPLPIQAGQMIAIDNISQASTVDYDPVVLKTLNSSERMPILTVFEPTFLEKVLDRLGLVGISFARLVTYITYGLILLSFIVIPILVIIRSKRIKKEKP